MTSKKISNEDKYSKNNILVNLLTIDMPIEKRKDIMKEILI